MQIEALKLEAENSTITAPQAGKILTINATPGESAMQLPLIEMANLDRMVCEVEVNEMDAAFVELQQTAIIRSRAFAAPLTGIVVHKSPLVGRPQLRPLDPLARVDYRAVTTLIELDAKSTAVGKDWLQLQVEVEIDTLRK
jgi:HlyD family secretion protein